MVAAQHVAHGGGAFPEGLVPGEAVLVHGVEDAAVHRLQAVPHVGQGPAHDDGHGVVDVALLHLLHQTGLGDVLIRKGDVLGLVITFMCH